jgi:micrococcal nuclease
LARGVDTSKLRLFPLQGYNIHVPDGDNVILTKGSDRVNVRLAGIDAPEKAEHQDPGQPGHSLSTTYLRKIVQQNRHNMELWIDPKSESHGRTVGVIIVNGRNINLELVELGLVRAHALSGGTNGIRTSEYFKAEDEARKQRLGIFRSAYYRAFADVTDEVGAKSHVRLSKPELLSKDFQNRVLASRIQTMTQLEMIRGIEGSDHTHSTFGGFAGMKPNRPDFPGAGDLFNRDSMASIERVKAIGTRLSKAGLVGDLVMSLDIETTGLDPSDLMTFGGFVEAKTGEVYQHPLKPRYPDVEHLDHMVLGGPGTTKRTREKAMRSAAYSGVGMTGRAPISHEGEFIDMTEDYIKDRLRKSGMPGQLKDVQLKAMSGQTPIEPEEFMREVFSRFEGKEKGWVFIHNAQFESHRLAAAIPTGVWEESLEKGHLAAGFKGTRYLHNPFDKDMEASRRKGLQAYIDSKTAESAKHYSEFYTSMVDYMTDRKHAPKGVKVVDTMDMARGFFAYAHEKGLYMKDSTFKVHGILSQDVLGAMLGMKPELHMPTPDAADNLEILSHMLEMSESIRKGDPTKATLDFFKRAEMVQTDMSYYSIIRDVANQVGREKSAVPIAQATIHVRGDEWSTFINPEDYVIGGQPLQLDDPRRPSIELPVSPTEVEVPIKEYLARRLKVAGLSGVTADEMLPEIEILSRSVQDVSPYDMYQRITSADYQAARRYEKPLDAVAAAIDETALTRRVEQYEAQKALKSTKLKDGIGTQLLEALSGGWDKLDVRTRNVAKGIGGVAAVLGVLGFARGLSEKEYMPEPQTQYSMEEYMAMKQMGLHANHDDTQMSMSMSSFRMVPNRYPTKV